MRIINEHTLSEDGTLLDLHSVYRVGVDKDAAGKFYVLAVIMGAAVRVASYDTWDEACRNAHGLSQAAQRAQGRIR